MHLEIYLQIESAAFYHGVALLKLSSITNIGKCSTSYICVTTPHGDKKTRTKEHEVVIVAVLVTGRRVGVISTLAKKVFLKCFTLQLFLSLLVSSANGILLFGLVPRRLFIPALQ